MADVLRRTDILIVDDKPDKILALEAALSDLVGVSIVSATSGREALRHLLTRSFAVILLDINMPGMDGFETAELIRQRKSSQDTPIIFITALADEPLMSRGYSLGAVDYILTPIIPEVLRTKVSVFVELARKTETVKHQARRLEQRAAQLSLLASQLAQAEQRERRRLARLLHDHLQQILVAAKMRVMVLRKGGLAAVAGKTTEASEGSTALKNGPVDETLGQVDRLLSKAIDASRSLTVQLFPPVLYDAGLGAALAWLARRMLDEHGLQVDVHIDDAAEPASDDLRILLFQAARELLFNVVKHANAKSATVTLARGPASERHEIRLIIEDDGVGFDPSMVLNPPETSTSSAGSSNGGRPARERFGLFSIAERLALLDGHMDIAPRHAPPHSDAHSPSTVSGDASARTGTRITLIVPQPAPAAVRAAESLVQQVVKPAPAALDEIEDAVIATVPAPGDNGRRAADAAEVAEVTAAAAEEAAAARAPLPGQIRVILADDHEILRKGIANMVNQDPGFAVVGEASNGKEAVDLVDRVRPDVVVMDVTMPDMNGIDATRIITAAHPHVVVIGLSMHEEEDMAKKMREAGAAMYLNKGGPGDALLAAIRSSAVAIRTATPGSPLFAASSEPAAAASS